MDSIKIFSPSSVANLSCGFDVLGLCLDTIGDEMIIKKSKKPGVRIIKIEGENLPLSIEKNVAGVAAKSYLNKFPTEIGIEIEIYKKIKAGSGIGSSAASAVGAVFGINELLERDIKKIDLIPFALEGEKLASGEAHADNIAPAMLGGFTLIRDLKSLDIIKLPSPSELVVTIIHPKIELKTSHARAILKTQVPLKNVVKQTANIAGLISGLYSNDYNLISRSLNDEIVEKERSLLIPKYYSLKNSALEAGALGCGISGSGPSIFALSRGYIIAKEVANSFKNIISKLNIDFDIYISKINSKGVRKLT
ncbi:MAG: homoserine kinase [Candidatus Marivariicella framensis]|jgi:homoserine kinase|tara:strand:- start:161 stop:1084 length:924 start_codon:yes stop_codon:yes gene_type:complete